MKYTVHGFSQEVALEFELSNDELLLLRWFVDFKDSGSMKKDYDSINNCMYSWVVYNKIIEDLPILTSSNLSLESKKKKLQRLLNGNLTKFLKKKTLRDKDGTYLYIALNEVIYKQLVSSNPIGQNCPTHRTKLSNGVGQNCPDKDSSINNSSINTIYTHWNSKNIINHKNLTKEIEKTIEKALKKYSENEIVNAIDIYKDILDSSFYFDYKWSLNEFLNRKNGISTFMEEGSNKANYEDWKKKGGNNGNRDSKGSTSTTTKSFEGNKLKENQGIELTDEERKQLDELE